MVLFPELGAVADDGFVYSLYEQGVLRHEGCSMNIHIKFEDEWLQLVACVEANAILGLCAKKIADRVNSIGYFLFYKRS